MASQDRQDKLEQLRRRLAEGDLSAARRLIQPTRPRPAAPAEADDQPHDGQAAPARRRSPATAEPRLREHRGPAGVCGWLHAPIRQVCPKLMPVQREYANVLRGARQRWDELAAPAELCKLADAGVAEVLLADLLAVTPDHTQGPMDDQPADRSKGRRVLLVGLLHWRVDGLQFDHYLARRQDEEPAALEALVRRMEQASAIVTFNGKRAAMPLLSDRLRELGLEVWSWPVHLDLLAPARRLRKGLLPNGRRPTLERQIFGRSRSPDTWRVALAAQRLEAGDDRPALHLARRQRQDLLAMARLLTAILTGCVDVEWVTP